MRVWPAWAIGGALIMALGVSCESADDIGSGGSAGAPTSGGGGQGGVDVCPAEAEIDTTPPPDPGTPSSAPAIACGTPTFAPGTGLRRHPYLQSITTSTARIAWTAVGATSGLVRVATSENGPWTEVPAVSELFDTARTNDTEDYLAFDARVDGLEPNQAYCYEVVVDGVTVASGLGFHSAWTDDSRPVRLLAFGDSGAATPEQAALRDVFMSHEFDVFLHLGDMAYGDGTFPQFEERVFDMYTDLLHRVPSYPTIGNHEYKTDQAQPYLDVYYLFEQALRPDDQERYYSFDYGNVHFVSLDSNDWTLIPIALDNQNAIDDDMIDWLRDDLAASDATWKVAFFHHPPFSLYEDRSDNTLVINQIMPALRDGDVDLILVGHDHHYVRSLPIRGDCEVPGGDGAIPFILVGSGGTGLHPFEDDEDWYVDYGNDQVHAFLSLTIHGCEGHGQSIDIEGNVIDDFTLNGCLH
jgi:Calcineurin-like phosphoesterase/Purple acid Phosphatase, N-terminal domain